MTDDAPSRFPRLRKYELRINLALTIVFLILLAAGVLLNSGVIAGLSFLMVIFFATYTVYAYVRRDL
ncbi:MAG: hypothetical protein ISF22_10760 [Methanomassiliicoccus sp.]|nr:hypothetical protein [Methanomassiliicoccus sp.]